ncbi:hypothetical protein D3C80_2022910 [compost metagenome]
MPITSRFCPPIMASPSMKLLSVNGRVRKPSAPNSHKPRPTSMLCSATDRISNSSTLAWAAGW